MKSDIHFWNGIAESYARKPVGNPEAFERKIAITLARMRPQHVVLDLGCGTGSLALRLAPNAQHIHGLDLSAQMVRIAQAKAQAANISNVSFHVGRLEDFEQLAAQSLDGVCAYSLLHLVADRAATLARIHQMLKPGGFFVSSTPCLGDSWIPYRPLLRVMQFVGKAPSVDVFGRNALTRELLGAGFANLTQPEVGATPEVAFIVAQKSE